MNILILTDFFPNTSKPHEGLFVWEQAKELKRRHSVVVIAPRYWYPPLKRYRAFRSPLSAIPRIEMKDGIHILRPVYRHFPVVGELFYPYWFFLKILFFQSIYAVNFDLIHAHWAYRSGWWAVLLGRLLRKPAVLTTHGSDINYWMNESVKKGRIRWALSQASGIIFVSQKLANKVKLAGIQAKKSVVISNAVSSEKFKGISVLTSAASSEKNILFVGNLFPVKGADRLLSALSVVKKKNAAWHVNLIGDGPERAVLEETAVKLGLNNKIKFWGKLPNPEVLTQLGLADLLVIPSRNEGAPLVLIEALALGKTVVAFDVGNVADVLNRPELGYVVKEQTPEALAAAILQAMQAPVHPELARKRASDYFLPNQVAKLEDFYRAII